jgi:very-short-patch-repair endonuclease
MPDSPVSCAHCGAIFFKDNREVKRSNKLGKGHFCTRSCSAKAAATTTRKVEQVFTCPCGKTFVSTSKAKAMKHCSRSCASHYSMNEERREAQRQSGVAQAVNLISTDEALRRRERWKYAALEEALVGRPHQFEYPLENSVFDLALLDVRVLVEFDGPEHLGPVQRVRDDAKDALASRHGFLVVRRPVEPVTIIDPSTITGL